LLRAGKLPARGFVGQEQVRLHDFLATRVGHYYGELGASTQATGAPGARECDRARQPVPA
jgi:hypothetical protein